MAAVKLGNVSMAQREANWFLASGMINADNLVNDGLNSDDPSHCVNNGGTAYTYNQGVVLGGLYNLYVATNNVTLLNIAISIANATMTSLVYADGTLRENCELSRSCDLDAEIFKGIFVRYLGYLAHGIGSAHPAYLPMCRFIQRNAATAWATSRTIDNKVGLVWNSNGATTDVATTTSGLDLFNAAILLKC